MAVALGGRRSLFVMSVRQAALAASRWQVEGVGLEGVGLGADVDGARPSESPGRRSACSNAHEHSLAPHPQQRIKLGMPSAFFGSN